MICSIRRGVHLLLMGWGALVAAGAGPAPATEPGPYSFPVQEVFWPYSSNSWLARSSKEPEGSLANRFASPDEPEFSLFPSCCEELEEAQEPASPPGSLFLKQSEIPPSEEAGGSEVGFAEPPEPWGWSQLPPPPLLEEELEPLRRLRYRRQVRAQARLLWQNIREDHRHFYSWTTFRDLGLGLALGAVLANTPLDQHFQDWYQEDVRSEGLDNLSSFWNPWGNGAIFIPSYATLGVLSILCPNRPVLGGAGRFGQRVSRAYLVGTPPLLFLQALTGAARPVDGPGSQWRPFQDMNGLSGHAFIGAVPFITAAQMTDQPLLQAALYLGSAFPAWSRLNDNTHYLSQVCLGWWLAYLACRAVNQTETGERPWTLVPIAGGNQIGLGLVFTR